jgi:hypothetical protein
MTYEERVVDLRENVVLTDHVVDLTQLNDVRFLESLHREVLACLLVLRKQHSAKGT